MRLATYSDADRTGVAAEYAAGRLVLLDRYSLPPGIDRAVFGSMKALLTGGQGTLGIVSGVIADIRSMGDEERQTLQQAGTLAAIDAVRLLAPVPDPSLILAAGMAYRSHNEEMKQSHPKEPHGFLKAPVCVTAGDADIRLPAHCADMVDFEGELCAIIGKACHNVDPEEAQACIAGYAVANDVSARDWVGLIGQATTTSQARTAWDLNHMGKQLPGFMPMSPFLVTADEVGRLEGKTLRTRVNGEEMQSADLGDLLFSPARMLSYFSRWYTFRPGDILSTGTPAGVGYGRSPQRFIAAQDVVEVEIDGIGMLANRFVN